MVSIGLDFTRPDGPSKSAAEVGWDYHLVIKGLSCSNRPGAIAFGVGEFLYRLFNGQSLIPVKYGYHTIAEDAGQRDGRTLRLSLAVEDGAAMSLDAALRSFCHKFFDNSDHTACQQLSNFGMYGFSPQEDKMKYFWYEAMFEWMSTYRMEKLADIEANLAAVQKGGALASWVPSWRGGLMLAVSLGLTWGATRMFGVPFAQGARLEVIKAINGIMMTEAHKREKAGHHEADVARIHCLEFVRIIEGVVRVLNEAPTEERSQVKIHRDATVHLIGLFECGYQTITVCTDVVLAFQKAMEEYTMSVMFSVVQIATVGFNFGMLLDAAETVKNPPVVAIHSCASLAISIAQMIYFAVETAQTEKQRKKWALIAIYVAASMKIAQSCECYLRWTYNSGVSNGEHSPQYCNELRNLFQAMEGSEPLPEDCTPEAIRARLVQYADTLNAQKETIVARLN